ncbi:GOLPH3/VPS74 family protein [Streptomyces celluloflavus]
MTPAPPPSLTLPEELLLLALDPGRGRPVVSRTSLRYGLAGAALADLAAAGRITPEGDGRFSVASPLPLHDPVLDGALAALPGPAKGGRGIRARRWVHGAGRTVQELCLDRLVERGAVRRRSGRVLGLFPYARFPAGRVDLTGPARSRFKAAADAHFPDPRSRLLGALASATGLDAKLLPGGAWRPLRRELRRLAKEEWTAHAVRQAIQQDRNAAAS